MKKEYVAPQMEFLRLCTVNVLTTSVDEELKGDATDWPWNITGSPQDNG